VYSEALTRTTARNGLVRVVFTPSLPGSDPTVIRRFSEEASPERQMMNISLYDCAPPIEPHGHWSLEMIEERKRNCPPHEQPARIFGQPTQGSGAVFPIAETELIEPRIGRYDIPNHWRAIWGIDFGIFHPFAAVLVLHDTEENVVHVHSCFRMENATPEQHCAKIRMTAANVPIAYPHDGDNREHGSGEATIMAYRRADPGLRFLSGSARNPSSDGKSNFATEPAILAMWQMMEAGRFKVSSDLMEWRSEFRNYHRDENGLIVKMHDDLMSATRIACMSLRFARSIAQCPLGPSQVRQASNVEMNSQMRLIAARTSTCSLTGEEIEIGDEKFQRIV
jgi:Terminase RNaseH-like domain